jgi:hypothetical protein
LRWTPKHNKKSHNLRASSSGGTHMQNVKAANNGR